MKQVIRDGKVGVLVSGGFGAGFSTWNELPKEAVFHPTLIEMVENKRHSEITKELVKELFNLPEDNRPYLEGAKDLEVEWVPHLEHILMYGEKEANAIRDRNQNAKHTAGTNVSI